MTSRSAPDYDQTARGRGRRSPERTRSEAHGPLPAPHRLPVLWIAVLYLATTGRWGSYVGIPGLPVYIGDILLFLGTCQVVLHLRRTGTTLGDIGRRLGRADMALLLCLSFLGWAAIRGVFSLGPLMNDPLLGFRDAAPYAYAVAALLAFLLSADGGTRQRRLIYAALAVHVTWVLLGSRLPLEIREQVLLGGAPIFTSRPDFDSAVAGVAIAFALYDFLLGRRPRQPRVMAALGVFAAANAIAISTLQTRAGLLASIVAIGAVLLIWATGSGAHQQARLTRPWRVTVLVVSLVFLAGVVAISPPGQRLVQAVRGQESQALGTVQVREDTWAAVTKYVFSDAARTAAGVGFGPDFVQDSGTAYGLQGTEYKDVRSPHNYILGTLARLGLAGALLAGLTILSTGWLAIRRLSRQADAATVVAALLVLSVPVTALLGVVLESPFGAIPYFWAIGQLARMGAPEGSPEST
jgi:O-antigen ligase